MKSHSWRIESPPAKRAGPIERAGLTEVPVAGMATKWMAARVRPMASGAKAGCSLRSSVTARMTQTKIGRHHQLEQEGGPPGVATADVTEGVLTHVAVGVEALEAVHEGEQHERTEDGADELGHDVERHLLPGHPAADGRTERHRRVEVSSRDPTERVDHDHHGEAEGQSDRRDGRRGLGRARDRRREPQPKKTRTKVPITSAVSF